VFALAVLLVRIFLEEERRAMPSRFSNAVLCVSVQRFESSSEIPYQSFELAILPVKLL
jgi:hypothetical protein